MLGKGCLAQAHRQAKTQGNKEEAYTTTALGAPTGGGSGSGMFGGGAGGGSSIAGKLRLGVRFLGGASCCPWPLSTEMLGLLTSGTAGAGVTDARFPGTKEGALDMLRFPGTNDGALETTRFGRAEERKGAGSERICIEVGRRRDWPAGWGWAGW